MRAGELLALRRCDVDLLRGVIHVRRALKDVDGRLEFGPTKTHTQRQVSLPAFLRDMLRDHLVAAREHGGPAGDGADALVFPSKTGQPLRHNLFYRRHFKARGDGQPGQGHFGGAAGDKARPPLPRPAAHMRGALGRSGAHVKLISARLGHSSVQITLDPYAHLFPSVEEALAEQLDALYRASPTEAAPENVARLHR